MDDLRFRRGRFRVQRLLGTLVVLGMFASGCGGSADEQVGAWCDQVKEGVRILKLAEDAGAGSEAETAFATQFGEVLEETNRIGWPSELSDELEVLERGPQFPGSAEDRELNRALDTYEEFVMSECELSPSEAELFVST